jgi:hypothetical protein
MAGISLSALWLAMPALAVEPGISETSSMTPNGDLTRADFARTITNGSDQAIDVAPRDLRTDAYPILTVSEITVGSFEGGIWTIGTLAAGQTATIVYVGDAAESSAAPVAATAAGSTAPTAAVETRAQPATEELPLTGPRSRLALMAAAGMALIGIGASLLVLARD